MANILVLKVTVGIGIILKDTPAFHVNQGHIRMYLILVVLVENVVLVPTLQKAAEVLSLAASAVQLVHTPH